VKGDALDPSFNGILYEKSFGFPSIFFPQLAHAYSFVVPIDIPLSTVLSGFSCSAMIFVLFVPLGEYHDNDEGNQGQAR